MNITPPDLRPQTRARQRAELTAIVAHEADGKRRGRVVPLLAAAAVVAVTAGLAFGVPALRQDTRQSPASEVTQPSQPVAPLSKAEKALFAKLCSQRHALSVRSPAARYQVLDGFRFTSAPADAYTTSWVVIKQSGFWVTCGLDAKGKVNQVLLLGANQDLYRAVEPLMLGAGAYASHIKRITVAVGDQEPVEATLRNGFFYAAMPYIGVRGPHTDNRRHYVVRGYDATGKLVYTSPRTAAEAAALSNACYLNPNGKLTVWQSDNPHPDPKTCRQGYFWNYGPN